MQFIARSFNIKETEIVIYDFLIIIINSYWRAKIATSGSDVKGAWKPVNSLLGETKTKYEPSFSAAD